jgi:hypothetical protein
MRRGILGYNLDVPPHQQRVVDEAKELGDRLGKLDQFIAGNSMFKTLPEDEQRRMRLQLSLMQQYEIVLQERIKHFPA